MKEILEKIYNSETLSREEAKSALNKVVSARCNETQSTAFISAYCMRSVTAEELSGFRDALMELCHQIDFTGYNTIDLCGTGGDGKNTFNISTLTSFVVAGTGIKVAKHGNYGVSSNSGSSNLLEYFGYTFKTDELELRKEIEKTNFCYFHAPLFNPAMKNVAKIRKELCIKTFFNMLGPLINPSKPDNQLIGVFNFELMELYDKILKSDTLNYGIVHSGDGFDEVSLTAYTKLITRFGNTDLSVSDFGFKTVQPNELYGGKNVAEASQVFLKILKGTGTMAQNNVVCANAALAFRIIDPQLSLQDAVEKANNSLQSGKAYQTFKNAMGQ